jgi:hypothetical protein
MRAVLLVALAACGGSQAQPTPAPLGNQGSAAPADVGLPALYAGLFVVGEKTFPGELVVSHNEVSGPVTEKTPGEVTCTVSDVQTIRGGKIAELTCSGLELVDQITGTYVGTARGLWKVDGSFENDIAKLDPGQALLGAVPAKSHSERKDAGSDIDSGSAILVEPHAGGWCVLVMSWGGDEGGWQLCFKEGAGVIGGHGFFAGGESRDAYFGDVRRI